MKAYACDICGALYTLYKKPHYDTSARGIWIGKHNEPIVADLCPECQAALEDLVKERKHGHEDEIVSAAD